MKTEEIITTTKNPDLEPDLVYGTGLLGAQINVPFETQHISTLLKEARLEEIERRILAIEAFLCL